VRLIVNLIVGWVEDTKPNSTILLGFPDWKYSRNFQLQV